MERGFGKLVREANPKQAQHANTDSTNFLALLEYFGLLIRNCSFRVYATVCQAAIVRTELCAILRIVFNFDQI